MSLKEQIINTAYELFAEKGYEKTTVAQIIGKAGTSKGGFYHHFKSKDEILEHITLSFVKQIQVYYYQVLGNEQLSIIQKFTETFYGIGEIKKSYIAEWPKLNKIYSFTGNHVLLKKMGEEFAKITNDFYLQLLKLGVDQNVFKIEYVEDVAALWSREVIQFHRSAKQLFFSNNQNNQNRFYKSLAFNQQLINYLLGLQPNTINLVSLGKNYVKMIRDQIHKEVNLSD
ncbi:TetR/AcrR family transcriptional regulator [Clostridium sp. 'deep sea']|uniref:TetR/AcrR family transcriptional regulator n=1 Tax=Clostridium sp. 'deep sea' TaxID=2779445 RepID=UPI0018964E27|nr:TetR/AcrR family transcriptional regulator [Clostridium sp. 'deep sea']QOR35101.1 TetR/AcrR family transcriptional regulator [Clostridium sp. 'deep sea']